MTNNEVRGKRREGAAASVNRCTLKAGRLKVGSNSQFLILTLNGGQSYKIFERWFASRNEHRASTVLYE